MTSIRLKVDFYLLMKNVSKDYHYLFYINVNLVFQSEH